MKELKANFLKVDIEGNVLKIYDAEPRTGLGEMVLKDAIIKIDEKNCIEVKGDKILWEFSFGKKFAEDLENKPNKDYLRFGYKSISDFIKGIKKPYIKSGWYKLDLTEPYHAQMSNWFLVL